MEGGSIEGGRVEGGIGGRLEGVWKSIGGRSVVEEGGLRACKGGWRTGGRKGVEEGWWRKECRDYVEEKTCKEWLVCIDRATEKKGRVVSHQKAEIPERLLQFKMTSLVR